MQLIMKSQFVVALSPIELRLINRGLLGTLKPEDQESAKQLSDQMMLQRAKITKGLYEQNAKFLELHDHPAAYTAYALTRG